MITSGAHMYEYHAELIRVVDGDTIHARVDLGLDVRLDVTLRLAGINTPEMGTEAGLAAAQYVKDILPAMSTIHTAKDRREKYGRYLAWVMIDDRCLNRMLVDSGNAVAYGNLPIDPQIWF